VTLSVGVIGTGMIGQGPYPADDHGVVRGARHRGVRCGCRGGARRRSIDDQFLTSRSGLAMDGELLLIAELDGAAVVLDGDDHLVTTIGQGFVEHGPAWPNEVDDRGNLTAPARGDAIFNSPARPCV